jgi:phospholipase A1
MKLYFKFLVIVVLINVTAYAQIDYTKVIVKKNMSQKWELDSIHKKGTFRLVSYHPIYFTAARWSSKRNSEPFTESGEFVSKDKNIFDNIEAKFQISFKSKLFQGMLFNKVDLWVGYTQKAHWQVYNKKLSRAFRELNYEPEIMLVVPLKVDLFGGQIRTFGLQFNHQSNGKDEGTSRSWNRVIFNIGYEYKNWNVNFKPWYRVPDREDENPNITTFIGNAELEVSASFGKHEFYSIMSHSFKTFEKGNIQLNYVFPIHGHMRGQLQVFQGYGETLIDYNVNQTTVGIGVSFADW